MILIHFPDDEKKVYRKVNQTLHKVNQEIEHFRFNTAIAALMELINELKNLDQCNKEIQSYVLQRFASMISPLAPHLGEECWQLLGNEKSLFQNPVWFEVDTDALVEDSDKYRSSGKWETSCNCFCTDE